MGERDGKSKREKINKKERYSLYVTGAYLGRYFEENLKKKKLPYLVIQRWDLGLVFGPHLWRDVIT